MPSGEKPPGDQDDLPSIEDFDERLKRSRPQTGGAGLDERNRSALGQAFRIGSELVAALLIGGAIGLGLDRWLGLTPWAMMAGLALGFAAGIVNVTRAMKEMNAALEEDGKDE